MRNGWGDPPLCRAHALVVDFDVDLDDPVGSLLEHADRFLSQQRGPLVQGFAQALGQFLRPPAAPNRDSVRDGPRSGRFEQGSAETPPNQNGRQKGDSRAPSSAPVSKDDPRTVLGFGPDVKLTREMVKARQRALAKLWHSDLGGSKQAMQKLNAAVAELLPTLK